MNTDTASKRKPKDNRQTETRTGSDDVERLQTELATVNRFLERIQSFSNVVQDSKAELARLKIDERKMAEELAELRDRIKSVKQSIDTANDGMIALIEPGPVKFMPLFDSMEKANTKKHGTNAAKWRELPVSELRLSPGATSLLYAAEILFIGQLQDRVLADPENWWTEIEGITAPTAAAIADKLADFVKKGGDV